MHTLKGSESQARSLSYRTRLESMLTSAGLGLHLPSPSLELLRNQPGIFLKCRFWHQRSGGRERGLHDPSGFPSGLVIVVLPGRRGLLFHNLSEILLEG